MPHFVIVLIFFKPFLDTKMSIFEEYGALNSDAAPGYKYSGGRGPLPRL